MISSFVILRYFNPALISPDVFGIIDREISANVRRPLVLLSKIIQNYANEIVFGAKESFMLPFNETRQKGVDVLKAYCKRVMEVPDPQEYYATVANLPVRKEDVRSMIFHNTCVTISPNQLYTITRLMDHHREKLVRFFHFPLFIPLLVPTFCSFSSSLPDSQVPPSHFLLLQAGPNPRECGEKGGQDFYHASFWRD
jgi:hypothetical protein